jgi:NADP-dependent 3-hydroxy acid dehydrogenase YdfG
MSRAVIGFRLRRRASIRLPTRREHWIVTTSLIVGGSGALGRVLARRFADRGDTVIVTSRTRARADAVATEIDDRARGLALDLSRPESIGGALVDVGEVDNLVISAITEAFNTLADFDIAKAVEAVTINWWGTRRPCESCVTGSPPTRPSYSSAAWPKNAPTPVPPW